MTPYSPPLTQVVGLYAFNHGDGDKVGFLLSRDEFHDFIKKKFQGHCFEEGFLEGIHELTASHVGACQDVIAVLQAHNVSHIQ